MGKNPTTRGCRSNREKKSVRDSILNPSSRGADGLKVLWEDGERVFCRGESDGGWCWRAGGPPAAELPHLPPSIDLLTNSD